MVLKHTKKLVELAASLAIRVAADNGGNAYSYDNAPPVNTRQTITGVRSSFTILTLVLS